MFFDDKIIGGIRVAQLRAAPRDCVKLPAFQDAEGLSCFGSVSGAFSTAAESRADYGDVPGRPFTWDGTGWGTSLQSVTHERSMLLSSFRTTQDRSYPPPAFAIVLPNDNRTEAAYLVDVITNQGYIDRQTRAIMVDMTVYNPTMNYFCFVRMTVEGGKVRCSCCGPRDVSGVSGPELEYPTAPD